MISQSAPQTIPIQPIAKRHRVLIVDDESAVLFAYRKLIEPEEFEVDTCETLYDAKTMIKFRTYLAIISDMRLEGTDNEDGIELLHFIREIQPDARVIIATGYGTEDLKLKAQTLGAAYYFNKPVLPSAIVKAIKTLRTTEQPASSDLLLESC